MKIRKNLLCLLASCYSKVDYSDLFFDNKCFFIIPLLDSHLGHHESQSEPGDGEFVELIITSNSKKMIVYKKTWNISGFFYVFYVFGEIFL